LAGPEQRPAEDVWRQIQHIAREHMESGEPILTIERKTPKHHSCGRPPDSPPLTQGRSEDRERRERLEGAGSRDLEPHHGDGDEQGRAGAPIRLRLGGMPPWHRNQFDRQPLRRRREASPDSALATAFSKMSCMARKVPRLDVTVGQFHARACEEQLAQAQAVSSESSGSTTSSVLGSVSLAVDSTLK
jgi:hypothetical protein